MYIEKYFYKKVEISNIFFFSIINIKGFFEVQVFLVDDFQEQFIEENGFY